MYIYTFIYKNIYIKTYYYDLGPDHLLSPTQLGSVKSLVLWDRNQAQISIAQIPVNGP